MRIRKKMNPDPDYFSKIHRIFLTRQNFQIFCLIFLLKLYKPFTSQGIFIISLFSLVQIWVLRENNFFFSFLLIICPLDPDPDQGSQNLADPDPKHCRQWLRLCPVQWTDLAQLVCANWIVLTSGKVENEPKKIPVESVNNSKQ